MCLLPHDDDLWHFIQLKKKACNPSEYIRKLIRNDMNNDPTPVDEERIVKKRLQTLQSNDKAHPKGDKESLEDMLAYVEAKKYHQ